MVSGFACRISGFLPPSPRPPSRREGGDQSYFYARGFAPCIPGAGRGAALGKRANHAPGGGRAPYRAGLGGHPGAQRGCLPSLPPALPAFALLSCPYPPVPLPGGEGGDFRLFYARGFAPCIPGAEPIRRGFDLWKTVSLGYAKDLSLQ